MLNLNVTNCKTQEIASVQVPYTYLSITAAYDAVRLSFGFGVSCEVRDPDETGYCQVSKGGKAQFRKDAPPVTIDPTTE